MTGKDNPKTVSFHFRSIPHYLHDFHHSSPFYSNGLSYGAIRESIFPTYAGIRTEVLRMNFLSLNHYIYATSLNGLYIQVFGIEFGSKL